MLRDSDNVGATFRKAFKRVDGIAMYIAGALWIAAGVYQMVFFDDMGFLLISILLALMNAFFFLMLGLSGSPGLLTAGVIAAFNIWFAL